MRQLAPELTLTRGRGQPMDRARSASSEMRFWARAQFGKIRQPPRSL